MDRLKRGIHTKVRSSTLIEVIVALIVISVVSVTAIMIYLNVQRSGLSGARISAMMMIDEVYATTVATHKFESKEVNYGDIVVYQTVKAREQADLVVVELEARNNSGKLIAERKHLIYAPKPEQ